MKGLLPDVSDLELLGITEVDFIRRLIQRTIFATVCGLSSTILWIFLWNNPPFIAVMFLCFAVPILSWHSAVKRVATASQIRRSDMDLAVAVYLDLVNVLLAGGAGVETAMLAAAGAGDGFSFEQIRLALVRAQSSRGSYWDSLRELGERIYGTLSEGEKKRVQISRALMTDPELLLLDEPAAGLDLGGREDLLRRFANFSADPAAPATILVTHHIEEIPIGTTHALLLKDGLIAVSGPIDQVLTSEHISAVFGTSITVTPESGRYFARASI